MESIAVTVPSEPLTPSLLDSATSAQNDVVDLNGLEEKTSSFASTLRWNLSPSQQDSEATKWRTKHCVILRAVAGSRSWYTKKSLAFVTAMGLSEVLRRQS